MAAGACLVTVLVLSVFSGYVAPTARFADAWRFAPTGLVTSFELSLFRYRSSCVFAGEYHGGLAYLAVFAKTCLIEVPFYLVLFRRRLGVGVATLVVANVLTHPAVFFGFPCLYESYLASLLASEAFAVLTEVVFVYLVARWTLLDVRLGRCALVIALANLVSWQIGAMW